MDGARETTAKPKRIGALAVAGMLAVIVLLFALFLRDILLPFLRMELHRDFEGAAELLRERGFQGFVTITLVEALQMVVVFIPAEFIQISSGLSYPFPIALLLCDLGVCLGATIIFVLVRVFHVDSAAYERRRQRLDRLSSAVHDRNTVVLLLFLFAMPFIPFGAICYYGSGTKLRYSKYIRTVAVGVIPSIVASNVMGRAGLEFLKNALPLWLLIVLLALAGVLLFLLGFVLIGRFCFKEAEGTPDSLSYAFLFFVCRLWQGKRQRVEIDDARLREVKAPYILLSNHESFFDFFYISQMAHPRNPSYLVNEYYCTRPILRQLAKRAGIVPKKLFTRDVGTAAGILRTVRKGFPIVIFPEGRLSPDGRSNPIVEKGGAFYRRLGLDLVLVKIDGAYFAGPKWRRRSYRSTVRVSAERVITAAELRTMTPEEIDRAIEESLYNDASAQPRNRYRQRDRAEGLENLLYRCADCGALYTTRTHGDTLCCTACGAAHRMDESCRFEGEIASIPAYYDRIRALEEPELDSFSLRAPVRVTVYGANGGPKRHGRGECFLTPEGFRFRSEELEFEIPAEKLPALAFSCGREFELYHDGELHYFYPTEQPQQVARWALLTDMLAGRRAEERERSDEKA
ncbi:MAG: 1-acyl-sn-glycerol-3-phosphate acyltransferase [Oscillospiraceae bacterium]|nr:1-acyl-sn-glycerol-3-phosphate acyltransferase [Oscillospiraceae bacterium]